MSDTWDDFVNGLEDDIPTTKTEDEKPRFPCGQCAGSGKWVSPMGRKSGKCHGCNGRGYFTTPPKKRAQARVSAAKRKAEKIRAGIAAFEEQHPEMFKELKSAYLVHEGNGFVLSLADQLFTRGGLTENQIAAWKRGKDKLAAMKAEREASATETDLSGIIEMFNAARESGYKSPKYRAEGLVISRAADHSRNPGALYVKNDEGEYLGKVVESRFFPIRTAPTETADTLQLISKDPKSAAIRWGQKTGRCSCCGRELTNHTSIEMGIGPICAEKWGF